MLVFAKLSNKTNLEWRPLIFENSQFCVELYFESMILSNFQEIILLRVTSFDRNAEPILLSKIADFDY